MRTEIRRMPTGVSTQDDTEKIFADDSFRIGRSIDGTFGFIMDQFGAASLDTVRRLKQACEDHLENLTDGESEGANRLRENRRIVEQIKEPVSGFVYLMQNRRNGYFKIGFSENPEYRERTLQAEDPDICLLFCKRGTMGCEEELHRMFSEKRLRGEWFALEKDDLSELREWFA